MATRIELYSREGVKLTEVQGTSVSSWVLNGIGQARIVIPKNSGLTEKELQFCNGVRIRHSVAGDWGGEIYTQRDWYEDTWAVTAYSAEHRLKRRTPALTSYTGSAGDILTQIITDANLLQDTGIDLYDAFSGGESWTETANANLLELLIRIQARSGQDWGFEPVLNASNRLRFNAYWYEARGSAWNFALEEGVNIEAPQGVPFLSEQGEIVNDLTLRSYAGSATTDINVTDAASQATYGLSQSLQSVAIPTGLNGAQYASVLLAEKTAPRRTFNPVALNVNNTFNYLGLGDTVRLKTKRYGWTGSGLGDSTRVRVLAKEYDERTGKMQLVVDEVTS